MLIDKTVLLTGATGSIGSKVAKLLTEEGATIILVDNNEEKLQQVWNELAGRHHLVQADIASSSGRQEIVNYCQQIGQDIDFVVNNASLGQFSLFGELDENSLSSIINLNLTATMLLTQCLLPMLLTQKQAQMINVGSVLGNIGLPGSVAYCASKFGLRGFTESLRRELLDTQVLVRYFAPQITKADINNEKAVEMYKALGKKIDTDEHVAKQLVSFIKAKDLSKHAGWKEKFFIRLNSLLPAFFEKSIFKRLPLMKQYL